MLAMETANTGDLAAASLVYEQVISQDPKYSAAYFHGGQTLFRRCPGSIQERAQCEAVSKERGRS